MQAIPFDNSYATLPERFYRRVSPSPVQAPSLIRVNRPLATYLQVDPDLLASATGVEIVAGNRVPEGADPIAMAYAGHQFGQFNPQLGDGRAILLGEVLASDGQRHDLQLKGSGVTPWSRGGDGRAPLGPVIREYVVSEAMAALGVPTSRALAAVTTGEPVFRERPLPGGVLLRVARSHIRVGTFEYFAARQDEEALRLLVEHVLARHYPERVGAAVPATALLEGVSERQADLIAQWMHLGFIHGVMNTDNMLVSGETIDYGPCAFMDTYDPETVFSSIDRGGRYAYKNQPVIAQFDLACLARAVLPLLKDEAQVQQAQDLLDGFPKRYKTAFEGRLTQKLGLSARQPNDCQLKSDFLGALEADQADFTLAFRHLTDLADPPAPDSTVAGLFKPGPALAAWIPRWQARLQQDPLAPSARGIQMRATNPALIPRNHLVEAAIRAAEDQADLSPFHALTEALNTPYRYDGSLEHFARPPRPEEQVLKTFCGT